MRLSFSAFLLSTALATGFGAGALTLLSPPATAQAVAQAGEVDVDALLALLPAEVKASYGSKSYDALSGVTMVRDLKIFEAANQAQNFVAIQEVALRGVDLAAFAHVFDFATYGAVPDETFRQLFGDIVLRDVAFTTNGQQTAKLAEIVLGGVQMKQLAAKPPGKFGAADDEKAASQFLGALLDSAITGEIKITGLTVEGGPERASIQSLVFGGINRGQFGPSSIDTVESAYDGMTMKMVSATADGADFTRVIPWLLKGELPPIGPEGLLYFGAAKVNGLTYEQEGDILTIGNYTIEPTSFFWLVPATLKISLNDLYYKPTTAKGSEAARSLGELGLDHLDIDMGVEWAFDGTTGGASLKALRISESQLFDAALSFDLTGINLAQLMDPATAQGAMFSIGVTGAQFNFKNNGGVDRILTAAARDRNTTPEAMKEQALGQLSRLEGGLPQPDGTLKPLSDRVKGIVAAFKAFITSPGTLTIKVQPATPITAMTAFGAMTDPIVAADTLGVTVEATPQ